MVLAVVGNPDKADKAVRQKPCDIGLGPGRGWVTPAGDLATARTALAASGKGALVPLRETQTRCALCDRSVQNWGLRRQEGASWGAEGAGQWSGRKVVETVEPPCPAPAAPLLASAVRCTGAWVLPFWDFLRFTARCFVEKLSGRRELRQEDCLKFDLVWDPRVGVSAAHHG